MAFPKPEVKHLLPIVFICVLAFVALFVYSRLRTMPLPNVIPQQTPVVPLALAPHPLAVWVEQNKALTGTIISVSASSAQIQINREPTPRTLALSANTKVYERMIASDFSYQDKQVTTSTLQKNRPVFVVLSDKATVSEIYILAN